MRAAIAALPDVERSVEAQREEMRGLEDRCKALRGVVGGLRGGGEEKRGEGEGRGRGPGERG